MEVNQKRADSFEENEENDTTDTDSVKPSIKQEQVHNILFSKEIGWQEIIYDLINTEQLDPWNIDITILTEKFMERIRTLEESDFFISSKVLLAAALLLRIKSEILLNKYLKSIDEILFGKKDIKKYALERLELNEEIPDLIPRSPVPRPKRITLQELMESLGKAITTENRRIKREILNKNALRESSISLPKRKYNITDKIKEIYDKLFGHLSKEDPKRVSLSEFTGFSKEEKIIAFGPLLHLENQHKIWLHQEKHFEEIYIWLKETYLKHNPDPSEELKKQLEAEIEEMRKDPRKRKLLEDLDKEFENPMAEMLDDINAIEQAGANGEDLEFEKD